VFLYLALYALINWLTKGKVTIGFISWFHLINVNINLEQIKISIRSISIQIRPMYYLHRKKLKATHHDGLIVIHLYKLKIDTSNLLILDKSFKEKEIIKKPNKTCIPTEKLMKILQWTRWILPITLVIHDCLIKSNDDWLKLETLSVSFNCDLVNNKYTHERELRNSIHFSLSNMYAIKGKVIKDIKWTVIGSTPISSLCSPKFSKLVSSCVGHGINIYLDELKSLISKLGPKKMKLNDETSFEDDSEETLTEIVDISEKQDQQKSIEEKENLIQNLLKKFERSDIYFAFDESRFQNKENKLYLKNMVYSINSTDKKDIFKKFKSSKLYKLTVNISGLKSSNELLKNSRIQMEFFNFFSIIDVESLIYCFKNIHDVEKMSEFTSDDSFISRSFLTTTNTSISTDIDDILKFQEIRSKIKQSSQSENSFAKKKTILSMIDGYDSTNVFENILCITHKLRTRAQFLTTVLQVTLADSLNVQFAIDDFLLCSSMTDTVSSLYDIDSIYVPTKSIIVAVRNIQFSIVDNFVCHKFFIIDLINCSSSIAVNNGFVVENTTFDIDVIEFLAEDILILKKLSAVAQKYANRMKDEKVNGSIIDGLIEEVNEYETDEIEIKTRGKSMLPNLIHTIKLNVHKVGFITCFKNPVKYWDGEDQSDINNFKRGFSINLSEFSLVLDNSVDVPVCDMKLKDVTVHLIRDYDLEKVKKNMSKILSVQNIRTKYTYATNTLSTVIPIIDSCCSVEVLWSFFFIKTILTSLKGRKINIENEIKIPKEKTKHASSKLQILVSLPLIMLKLQLPTGVDLAFEVDSLKFIHAPAKQDHEILLFRVARIYGQNPHADGFWTLLMIVSNAEFKFKSKHLLIDDEPAIGVNCDDIRLEIPYQYVFYKTFDNLKAFFKSIKKLKLNFHDMMYLEETDKDFKVDVIKPSLVQNPVRFPRIKIRSKRILYCNHDDPFEEELTGFLMLSKLEQQVRLSKIKEFEKYECIMMKKLKEKYEAVLAFEGDAAIMPKVLKDGITGVIPQSENSVQMKKSLSTGFLPHMPALTKSTNSMTKKIPSKLSNQIFTEECEAWLEYQREYHFAIEIPKKKLYANISKSWTSRVKSANRAKQNKGVSGCLKTDPKVRKEFLRKFPVIVEGNFQPLFGFRVICATLDLNEPEFGLENYADYIYRVANGVPKGMKYGILVPMNLKLSCSQARIQIKDYPLPLVGFGGNEQDGPETVKFDGDLVICEQKYTEDEIRYNFVPCVPQYNDPRKKDSLYAFHIARTMTNVKFITDMNVYVDSNQSAAVSWAPSLQPGMSYSFDSFDLLSKPPLDISPKIGFWDKMPLLVPSKFTFHFTKGITLFIKASQSPYSLIGRNAGFAFKWEDDVKVSINSNNKSEDFLIVESKVFEMGVPVFDPSHLANPLNSSSCHALNAQIAKVILRLTSKPIIWKLGFVFERNINNESNVKPGSIERTRIFRPHYDVSLKNPTTFVNEEEKEFWDSYEGWRSHYIYLALSVYSRDDNKCKEIPSVPLGSAYNSLYLSPMSFFYFFFWWNSFKSSLGLPIRGGEMFKNKFLSDKKAPKFGKSIFGISYNLDLSPLYLTHVYQHSSTGKNGSKVAFTGLKCFVKSFTMDLHQCRREVIILDDKTKTVSREYNLKMDKGLVDFVDADLRILTAVFNQTSATGLLERQLGLDKTNTSISESDSSSSHSEDYMDRVWYDHNDFVELEAQKIPDEEPKWKVYEFASSPRFYYVRDNPSAEVDYPFDYIETQTHRCQLGDRDLSKAASDLVDIRLVEIEDQINFYKVQINDLLSKPKNQFVEKTLNQHNSDLQELHHRLHVLRCLKDSFSEGIFPDYDEFLNDQEVSDDEVLYELSKVTSRVSSHLSRSKSKISNVPLQSSNYRNRFSVYAVNVKWTKFVKSGFFRYLENLKDRRFLKFSMSQQALNLARDLSALDPELNGKSDLSFLKSNPEVEFEQSKDLLDDFDQILHDTTGLAEAETDDSYLLKFILPQIAITTDTNRCVLVTANKIALRSVIVKGFDFDEFADEITLPMETRNGLTLTESFIYCLERENILTNKYRLFTPKSFCWPPKLPLEMHYTPISLDECIVAQNISCVLLYTQPNTLHYSKNDKNTNSKRKETIRIVAPDVNVTANSIQYRTLVDICTSLFEHDDTEIQKVKALVQKFVKYSDFSDFKSLHEDLQELQNEARQLLECRRLMVNANYSNDFYVDDIESVNIELEKISLNLNAIVDILQSSKAKRYNEFHKFSQWTIMVQSVSIQFLDDNALKIVEISAIDAYYMFTQSANGESINTAYVFDFAVFDKHPKATCETVVTRSKDTDTALVRLDWHLLPPVGGIKMIKKKVFRFSPLKVEFDMRFAQNLQEFMFPKSKILEKSDILEDDEEDDFYNDMDTTDSDSSSIVKLNAVASEITLDGQQKEGSKISRALHRFLPKHGNKTKESLPKSKSTSDSQVSSIESRSAKSAQPKCATDEVKIMEQRSSKYYMMSEVLINEMDLIITFKGVGKLGFINLTDFHVKTPKIEIINKMMSNEELFALIRKQLVRYVLKNTHNVIRSSLKMSKSSKGTSTNSSVNPVLKQKEKKSFESNSSSNHNKMIQNGHAHTHRLQVGNAKFRDTDLLEPQIKLPPAPNKNSLLLSDLIKQDHYQLADGNIDETAIFTQLDDVQEEE
jgi:hypothetical protein